MELLKKSRSESDFLPFHMPDLGEKEINAVVKVLRSGRLTTSRVKQFEEPFSRYTGASYAVAGIYRKDSSASWLCVL
jgi:dTDP-4-amino-4,6-dideoxygalactose transaminase